MFVTPNPYVHGDVNTFTHPMVFEGEVEDKHTPLALVGDVINLLSNNWNISDYRQPGLNVTNTGVTDGGTLARPVLGTLTQCLNHEVYHVHYPRNLPTNKQSVYKWTSQPALLTPYCISKIGLGRMPHWLAHWSLWMRSTILICVQLESSKVYGPSPFGMMAPLDP